MDLEQLLSQENFEKMCDYIKKEKMIQGYDCLVVSNRTKAFIKEIEAKRKQAKEAGKNPRHGKVTLKKHAAYYISGKKETLETIAGKFDQKEYFLAFLEQDKEVSDSIKEASLPEQQGKGDTQILDGKESMKALEKQGIDKLIESGGIIAVLKEYAPQTIETYLKDIGEEPPKFLVVAGHKTEPKKIPELRTQPKTYPIENNIILSVLSATYPPAKGNVNEIFFALRDEGFEARKYKYILTEGRYEDFI